MYRILMTIYYSYNFVIKTSLDFKVVKQNVLPLQSHNFCMSFVSTLDNQRSILPFTLLTNFNPFTDLINRRSKVLIKYFHTIKIKSSVN